jgi:hypothetical protein
MQHAPEVDTLPGIEEELASLRSSFPAFHILLEAIGGRRRYVARRIGPGTRPHTVMTSDPDELRAALTT